ncbi:Patronin [Armadillidium nasatum]|uniref:Patronin n=1 Tax=Armadillidium nasatum TaxID=96803 RepID=A0A5N5TN93_9CRUS|nr:Patronin [Armadillidium nasatum]
MWIQLNCLWTLLSSLSLQPILELSLFPHLPLQNSSFPNHHLPQPSLPAIPLNNSSSSHITHSSSSSSSPKLVPTKTPPINSSQSRPNTILYLKDLGTEVSNMSKRWLESSNQMEELRTPDMDAMDYEEYQKSLSQMTDSLTEIQSDIQRLNQQQHQIQTMMHNGVQNSQLPPNAHPHLPQQQLSQFYLHEQQGSPVRRMWSHPANSDGYSSLSPATRRAQWGPVRPMVPQGEYLMGGPPQPTGYYSYQMNQQPMQLPQLNQMGSHQPPPTPPTQQGQGHAFMLHGQPHSLPAGPQANVFQNGQNYYSPDQYRGYLNHMYGNTSRAPPSQTSNAPFRLHNEGTGSGGEENRDKASSSLRSSAQSSPSRQGQQPIRPHQKSPSPSRQIIHAPVSAPPPDDMEPQNVCFIDSDEADKLKRLSISSGSRTYRISHEPGSPTRPTIGTKTFRVPTKKGTPVYDDADLPQPSPPQRSYSPPYSTTQTSKEKEHDLGIRAEPLMEGPKAEKGFYISLDDNPEPKRPKPPLRTRRLSQKKTSAPSTPQTTPNHENAPPIPDRTSLRNSSGILDSPSYGSLKMRRDSSSNRNLPRSVTSPVYSPSNPLYTSRSDATLSPSSSASSIPASRSNSTYWSPENSRSKFSNIGNSIDCNDNYNYSDPHHGSDDTGSDTNFEERTKVLSKRKSKDNKGMSLVIGEDLVNQDSSLNEMEKKKEKLMMMSMRRKQQQEEMKRKKEMEGELKREEEKLKEDMKQRKKEEERARRELILERHKIKKAIEEAEKEGRHYTPPAWYFEDSGSNTPTGKSSSSVRLRSKGSSGGGKPRPKTMHEASFAGSEERLSSKGKKGSYQNVAGGDCSPSVRKSSGRWGSSGSLSRSVGNRGSTGSIGGDYSPSPSRTLDRHSGRRPTSVIGSSGSLLRREHSKGSLYGSRGAGLEYPETYQVHESRRPSATGSRMPTYRYNRTHSYDPQRSGHRKYRSTGNLYGHGDHENAMYHMSEDSGIGRATPPRRAPSPGMSAMTSRHLPSPSGPGSLPPGLFARRRPGAFDDNMSDISTTSSNMDYCGPRLFKQPMAKSNRNIILNAVEYCVFPGVVNQTAKQRVLEEVARSESKHFLILFRDSGCQFRALYSYNPDLEEVFKLYGTGPKQVTDRMFDKFFKYNSGGKCFSQIHTKHLTVTIDAFTIHNSLWQGKKVNLPPKKDMKLVI